MRISVALAFLLLAACHKGWDWKAANQRYLMMLSNDASEQELCAEAKRDAKAALNALDEQNYQYWSQMAKEDCDAAANAQAS